MSGKKGRSGRGALVKRGLASSVDKHTNRDPLARHIEDRMTREEIASIIHPHIVENPRLSGLHDLLLDPDCARVSLGTLCARVGLPTQEVVEFFKKTRLAEAVLGMYDHLPAIVEDAAIDAKSTKHTCWKCLGEGEVKKDKDTLVTCPECNGSKRLRKPGDSDARKLVFETAGLAGKRGPATAIQLNVSGGGVTIEDVSKKTEEVLSSE